MSTSFRASTSAGEARLRYRTVVFDVDSTLAALEGVDWLAARCGQGIEGEVRLMTERAMSGEIALESVYAARLALIKPSRLDVAELAAAYIDNVQPGARALCAVLSAAGCEVVMVSGGLRDAILPLAEYLGVPEASVHAVGVEFDADGKWVGVNDAQLLATQQGKPAVLLALRDRLPRPLVMVGDGSTDAAVRGVSDGFIAYTGVTRRASVVAVADAEAVDFKSLYTLLFEGTA